MADLDGRIGDNVARLRKGRSQREVASEMKKRGWRWSHVTLVAIEGGERPLRLSEAVDLAAVLDTDVRLFFEPTGNIAWNDAYMQLSSAQRSFKDAVVTYSLGVTQAISGLGDVDLTSEQEESLQDLASVTAMDLVGEPGTEGILEVGESLEREDLDAFDPLIAERMRRTSRRLRPVVARWRAQGMAFRREARDVEHPEAP